MKKTIFAYKVVKRKKRGLYSAMIDGKAEVCYEEGHLIYPPKEGRKRGYGLTVFRNSKALSVFCEMNHIFGPEYEIWRVEIDSEDIIKHPPPAVNLGKIPESAKGVVKTYPIFHRKLTKFAELTKWPRGTLVVRKLKLIRSMGSLH